MEIVRSRAFSGFTNLEKTTLNNSLSIVFSTSVVLLFFYIVDFKFDFSIESGAVGLATVAMLTYFSNILQRRESSTVLLPVIDSCNHCSISPNAGLQFNPADNNFELFALKTIPAGNEVEFFNPFN